MMPHDFSSSGKWFPASNKPLLTCPRRCSRQLPMTPAVGGCDLTK